MQVSWAIFLLSFFGFAVKAGLVPVNSWLPLAHPVAPTNVSALLSTVIVNLGVYGIVRLNLDLAPVKGSMPGLIVLVVRQPVGADRHSLRDGAGGNEASACP